MSKLNWQERESDSIVDFGFSKVVLRKQVSKKGRVRYLAHIENSEGKEFASFDFGSELEGREIVEDWASVMIGELDQATDPQTALERQLQTLDYCKTLLPSDTPPLYFQRIDNVKEWLRQGRMEKRSQDNKLELKLFFFNILDALPTQRYSLNWSQFADEDGIFADSPHGKIIIRSIPESQQIAPRSPYEIVAKFRIYIYHPSGAVFECWHKQPVDIESAKKNAEEVLQEMDNPTLTEEYDLHIEYFFKLLSYLLPDNANPVHRSRLERMSTEIISFLI
ncbi:MAG: hypothetical protein K8L91_19440 [Anaerolineae bacterium]|nr:hypothetical protein [Anaerolineae bacterium]